MNTHPTPQAGAPLITALAWLLLAPAASIAQPLNFVIDPAQSSITVTLDLSLVGSDTDSTPIEGFLALDPNDPRTPSSIILNDYLLRQQQDIDLDVGNFLGRFIATASGIEIALPANSDPIGPVTVTPDSSSFLFMDVPATVEGLIAFDATGLVCTAFQAANLECEGSFDLATDFGQVVVPELAGVYIVTGDTASVQSAFQITQPLDPDNPDLGSITIDANVVAEASIPAPCPADLTGPDGTPDGTLDANDFFEYLARFASGDPDADLTGSPDGSPDGVIDANDFFQYLSLFAAGCP